MSEDASERVRALCREGLEAFRRGAQSESRAFNEEALELARETGDAAGIPLALSGLSRVAFRAGDYGEVRRLAQEAREAAGSTGDLADGTVPLHMLAAGTRLSGDYEGARTLYLETWS